MSTYLSNDYCKCDRPSMVVTSWTPTNPARRFICCQNRWVSITYTFLLKIIMFKCSLYFFFLDFRNRVGRNVINGIGMIQRRSVSGIGCTCFRCIPDSILIKGVRLKMKSIVKGRLKNWKLS